MLFICAFYAIFAISAYISICYLFIYAYYSYTHSDIKGVDFPQKRHFLSSLFTLWGCIHPPKCPPICPPNCPPNTDFLTKCTPLLPPFTPHFTPGNSLIRHPHLTVPQLPFNGPLNTPWHHPPFRASSSVRTAHQESPKTPILRAPRAFSHHPPPITRHKKIRPESRKNRPPDRIKLNPIKAALNGTSTPIKHPPPQN